MGPSPRNIAIILGITLVVWLVPGGGTAAEIIGTFISIAFGVAIFFALVYVYRNFRTTIYSLGDQNRGLLYGALASILFLGAAADRFFDSAAGTFVWFAILGVAAYAAVTVFRSWREYA